MKIYYFAVTSTWIGMPENLEPAKHTDMQWFALDDLPSPFVPHHMSALDCFHSGKAYTETDVAP